MKLLPRLPGIARVAAVAAACAVAGPAAALYKVVNADGSVTYTDRIPAPAANSRVTQMGPGAAAVPTAQAESGLPTDLRLAMQRYPVTLYTASDCPPCRSGRQLLLQRGVPFSERVVATAEDAEAFERLVGARTVPALTVGAQPLRGYSEADWQAYLDAAGYPRQSRLPRGWQPPQPQPVVERAQPAPVVATPAAAPPPAAAPIVEPSAAPAEDDAADGVRF